MKAKRQGRFSMKNQKRFSVTYYISDRNITYGKQSQDLNPKLLYTQRETYEHNILFVSITRLHNTSSYNVLNTFSL